MAGLTFGIYAGSAAGGTGGPPDDPDRVRQALGQLQGKPGRPFAVRAYEMYTDPADVPGPGPSRTPEDCERYLGDGRLLDLVVTYHSRSGDVDGYCAFIEDLIDSRGERIATLQIAEEANITDDPVLDGCYPRVTEALISGVWTARERARLRGHTALKVGCNSTPLFGPAAGFFSGLTAAGGQRFIDGLDYIGLDFFPDVFRPVAPGRLETVVAGLLEGHRRDRLAPAGLGRLPLIITEHGWPTPPGRSPRRQAEVLETVVRVVARNAGALNITGYTHHALRDTRSDSTDLMCHFGLMTDDYTPKPAFQVYASLIAAHSG